MSFKKSRFAGATIVVADDERVIVELAGLLLKRRGFKVHCAYDGAECLRQVEEHQPALVLLDYMMPVMNGLDTLKRIRALFPETYVLMFTGKGSEEVAVEMMRAGASDYLQKPFANNSLQERIDAVLSLRQVELENRALLGEKEALQQEVRAWNRELEQRVRQKTQELERAHQEIIQAEKMAALGHLSAGMAHEIRNPLNSINLFAEILSDAEEISPENRSYLRKITEEVERIDGILRQLLVSSPKAEQALQWIDLNSVLQRVLHDNRERLQAQRITLEMAVDEQLPSLKADPSGIEQIFSNLLSNALQEMPDGGVLEIVLKADAEQLALRITDSGSGIPDEYLPRIFDPFFTTRDKGTGFGLSVVMRAVKDCGGRISATNAPGKGASFMVELPLLPASIH